MQEIARAVMSRLVHEPTIRLRSLSEERAHASLEIARELFGLHEEGQAQGTPAELAEVHDLQSRHDRFRRPR